MAFRIVLIAVISLWATVSARAEFPDRTLRLVVPFSAGGSTDAIARMYAEALGAKLGANIVIDNVSGAGGALAAVQVAKAVPDGYTLFFGTTGTLSINPSLYRKLAYQPLDDFAPIGMIGTSANALLIGSAVKVKSLPELIDYAKSHPGELTFGSAGIGSSTHLAGELMRSMTGIDMVHIPYRGSSAAATDLLGGRISLMFETIPTARQLVQQNGIRTFGVTSPLRITADEPTISESGIPGFDVTIWFALLGPKNLPEQIVAKLNAASNEILHEGRLMDRLKQIGVEPAPSSPKQLQTTIVKDGAKWKRVIESAGISLQ